MKFATKVT